MQKDEGQCGGVILVDFEFLNPVAFGCKDKGVSSPRVVANGLVLHGSRNHVARDPAGPIVPEHRRWTFFFSSDPMQNNV